MSEIKLKWILFTLFSLMVPLYFGAPMAGDFYIPLILIAYHVLDSNKLFTSINPFSLMILVQFIIAFFLVFFTSKYIARWIYKLQAERIPVVITTICALLLIVTFLPIYGFESGDNLYKTYTVLFRF